MKKLLTIICSLCLVMAFSMPAAAQDDNPDAASLLTGANEPGPMIVQR